MPCGQLFNVADKKKFGKTISSRYAVKSKFSSQLQFASYEFSFNGMTLKEFWSKFIHRRTNGSPVVMLIFQDPRRLKFR